MKLGDVVQINPESVGRGYPHSEIQYVDISSVGTGTMSGFTAMPIAEAPSRAKRIVRSGDTLLATVRPNLRSFCYLRNPPSNAVASTGFAVLRATEKIDKRFLYFTIINQSFTDFLCANVKGAAYPAVDTETIARAEIELPDLPTQRRIASILSAYDDLIENNTRRIAILEEMARRIYEEWFVRFRFPEHEKVRMVESELGLVPEGWEVTTIGNIASNHDRKRKPLSKMQRETFKGPYPYYGAAKVFDYVQEYIFDGRYVLMAEDGSVITQDGVPVLQLANGKFWANNHTHILQGTKVASTEYIYLCLRDVKIAGYITGAAQPKITQENMNRIPVVLPPELQMRAITALVKPKFDLIDVLERKNNNLRTTRDLLLPKLISGELDVSHLPEPEAMAA